MINIRRHFFCLALAFCALALVGCAAAGTAVGGASDTNSYGRIKVGIPF